MTNTYQPRKGSALGSICFALCECWLSFKMDRACVACLLSVDNTVCIFRGLWISSFFNTPPMWIITKILAIYSIVEDAVIIFDGVLCFFGSIFWFLAGLNACNKYLWHEKGRCCNELCIFMALDTVTVAGALLLLMRNATSNAKTSTRALMFCPFLRTDQKAWRSAH